MGVQNHCGDAEWLRRAPKSPNNLTSTFFNTVRLLPKDLRFEHGGAKLASCPGRHHGRPQKFFQGRGQHRRFACPFQVSDDAMQTDVHITLYPSYSTSKIPHCNGNIKKMRFAGSNSQEYYDIIYTIGYLQFEEQGTSFQRSITMVFNETTNYDFILPAWQHMSGSHRNKSCKRLRFRRKRSITFLIKSCLSLLIFSRWTLIQKPNMPSSDIANRSHVFTLGNVLRLAISLKTRKLDNEKQTYIGQLPVTQISNSPAPHFLLLLQHLEVFGSGSRVIWSIEN